MLTMKQLELGKLFMLEVKLGQSKFYNVRSLLPLISVSGYKALETD